MKYTKKTLSQLTSELRSLIDLNFSFKNNQQDSMAEVNKFFDRHFKTDSGKKRYPDYYRNALNAFWSEYSNVRQNENLIFCYDVSGKLYTTYNPLKKANYYFKGQTDIQDYRTAGIDDRVLWECDNGFYYPCGKPYFVKTKI